MSRPLAWHREGEQVSKISNLCRLMEVKLKDQAEKPSGCSFILKVTSEGGGAPIGDKKKTVFKAELGDMDLKMEGQEISIKLAKMERTYNYIGGIETFKCEASEPFTDQELMWLNKLLGHEMNFKWKGKQKKLEFKDPPIKKIA